jgi:16S rRNA (uracil1498-N3)-methyltransferase
MTTNFYAPPSALRGQRVVLPDAEAHHARSVLRVTPGDRMTVVDGEGGWYRVQVDHAAEAQVVGHVVEAREDVGEPAVQVTVGIGLIRARDRFETFVEKAVELGVHRIVPLHTRHAETSTLRRDRTRKVMVAALKQCRRSWLPALGPVQSVEEMLAASAADRQFLCTRGEGPASLRRAADGAETVAVLVGPEGGFSAEEKERAVEAGSEPVSLGGRRLRAETAGIAAVHAVVGP